MVNSMTGYGAREAAAGAASWSWELRSVNARGLDIRMRLPERMGALEAKLRERLSKSVTRGAVTLSLRIQRSSTAGLAALNEPALLQALAALTHVENAAEAQGMVLDPCRATDILAQRGVFDTEGQDAALPEDAALLADFEPLLAEFLAARCAEGAALKSILEGQLAQMDPLIGIAAERAVARRDAAADTLRDNVRRLLDTGEAMDEGRIAQELALLAVKADVTEEVDRLRAHVAAARELLASAAPVGRRLDFLMQEFNREANTLCSKSADTALTRAGLDLKVLIDQMREQVQNVE